MFIGFSFAADCWVNSQWNKYCKYDNGCYEYWNQNGTHYSSCAKENKAIAYWWASDPDAGRNYPGVEYEEEMKQRERDIQSEQRIAQLIKDRKEAHVMSFWEIFFYIIVAFVFTIVVIMPAKDAFWPKK